VCVCVCVCVSKCLIIILDTLFTVPVVIAGWALGENLIDKTYTQPTYVNDFVPEMYCRQYRNGECDSHGWACLEKGSSGGISDSGQAP
jgi:hypothetical protein